MEFLLSFGENSLPVLVLLSLAEVVVPLLTKRRLFPLCRSFIPETVKIFVLPGGVMPRRQTTGAIGFDVHLRAIVHCQEMDPNDSRFRRTLLDFKGTSPDPSVANNVIKVKEGWVYRLHPGQTVLVGVGFATEMHFPLFFWVAPRSGLASRHRIQITNAPGTVDPDYRGEAGVLVLNLGSEPFDLHHQMRIAQVAFQHAVIPRLQPVSSLDELSDTSRGAGGFGSTGVKN